MERLTFRIKGMCCGDEISILKRSVGPVVGGELNLTFDLLNGKMTVHTSGKAVSREQIEETVAGTGMQAVPWMEECAAGVCAVEEGAWQRHGRLLLCAASGLLALAGFLADTVHHGSVLSALAGDGRTSGGAPLHSIVFYACGIAAGGWFVAPRAFHAARQLRPDMNLLMTVAVIGAIVINQWFEAASVAFLFSLALLLESWSIGRARNAIKALTDIVPQTARFLCPADGDIEERPVGEVPVGATVLVRPGEKIPLDGVVTSGTTSVNEAPITGESIPAGKEPGDQVFAGTINGDGAVEFRSTKPAGDTTLARIIRMVEEGQAHRAPTEQWVERFARFYTPFMMFLSAAVAVVPPLLFGGEWHRWFYEALVLLVIACPCSLLISTPVSIVAGLTSAARNGVLIKGGAFLEAPAHLRAIAFDKTGTLTRGEPSVVEIFALNGHTEEDLLAKAASLEAQSTHPLARAVLNEAEARGIAFTPAQDFTILPGQGAMGTLGDARYWIGSHRMLEHSGKEDPRFHEMAARLEDGGHSLVAMWCDEHICGVMSIADRVRPEAKAVVSDLKALGISRVVMITGDNDRTASHVAALIGPDDYRSELLPEDKVRFVSELKKEFGPTAMVGDGVNDAPAMTAASLAVAMGAMGSDAAIETADIALMSDDLTGLPWLVRHSRRTLSIIKQNITFSIGVKAAFVLLCIAGMANLWGAIAADMGASLLVIFNGLRLLGQERQCPEAQHTG